MEHFRRVYPEIDFSISRNQTELLDYTISNLQQNLTLGFLFICLVAVLFLGDVKSPLVIGLSMVVSIVISFVFFYLCNMSLNIISGMVLTITSFSRPTAPKPCWLFLPLDIMNTPVLFIRHKVSVLPSPFRRQRMP